MKMSLMFSILLIGIFAVLGWKNHGRLEEAKRTRSQLVKKAAELSIPSYGERPRVTKRVREESVSFGVNADEARTKVLKEIRDSLNSVGDRETARKIQKERFRELARESTYMGFNAAMRWVESSSLSPDEMGDFVAGVAHSGNYKDAAEWVQWMNASLPADVANPAIRDMVSNWSRNDYRAAGKWLAGLAEGDFRNLTVSAFAKEVSNYAPDAAVQWAKTLPPGPDRDEIIHRVYIRWPEEDPKGRAAFAQEHGIR
jgi:hypothetical protein